MVRALTAITISTGINEIKFLTIHGSKGLEAKVVFLIDNHAKRNDNKTTIIKTENEEFPIFFKIPKVKSTLFEQTFINTSKESTEEENKRLLYVATTRAEERLYICTSAKDITKLSTSAIFYNYIQLSVLNEEKEIKDFFNNKNYYFIDNCAIVIK